MGNAADCNYCDNRGKPWSFGCPRCHKFDRSESDAKEQDRADSVNATREHHRMLEGRVK